MNKNITIDKLPVPTWNSLRMNDARLDIDMESAVVKDIKITNGSDNIIVIDDDAALTIHNIHIDAAKNESLKLYVINMAKGGTSIINIEGGCEENASIELAGLYISTSKSYVNSEISLKGDKSSYKADSAYLVKKNNLLDMNYVVRHIGKSTDSQMNFSGVLEENSEKTLRGTIDFVKGCKESKGNEIEKVLLLGDRQTNKSIPLILCSEEAVEGNHGASISRLDDKSMFYLLSRGISMLEAESMIARARIDLVKNLIPDKELVDTIDNYLYSGEAL